MIPFAHPTGEPTTTIVCSNVNQDTCVTYKYFVKEDAMINTKRGNFMETYLIDYK